MSDPTVPVTAGRGGGLKQDPFDPRDHYYQAQASTQPPSSINLRQDHAQLATEIYDQLQTGSCTANAAAAAFWYEEKAGRRAQVWGSAGPSRLFIYWLARGGYENSTHDIPGVYDSGSNSRDAMKGIATVGACPEADCPFVQSAVNSKPSNTAFADATPHKITSYYRLDPDRPDSDNKSLSESQKAKIGTDLLENLRKCLTEGFPVAFGFWYYLPEADMWDMTTTPYILKDVWNNPDSKFQYPRNTFPDELPDILKLRENGKVIQPGHSVLAIGYDDHRKQVLVQNSWGKDWSGNGTFWMPYAWITDFAATNDFWTIRTTHTPPARAKGWQEVHQQIMAAA